VLTNSLIGFTSIDSFLSFPHIPYPIPTPAPNKANPVAAPITAFLNFFLLLIF